jgi:hypothetical protein
MAKEIEKPLGVVFISALGWLTGIIDALIGLFFIYGGNASIGSVVLNSGGILFFGICLIIYGTAQFLFSTWLWEMRRKGRVGMMVFTAIYFVFGLIIFYEPPLYYWAIPFLMISVAIFFYLHSMKKEFHKK